MAEHQLGFNCADESVVVGDHNKRTNLSHQATTNSSMAMVDTGTMTLKVRVRGHDLVALVDSGASMNVLSEAVVARLGLSPCPSPESLSLATASGELVPFTGLCRGLDVHVLGPEVTAFRMDCYVMSLVGNITDLDLLLGTPWLRALGPVLWDFTELTMSCTLHGRLVTWRGDTWKLQSTGSPLPPPMMPRSPPPPRPPLRHGPADNTSLVAPPRKRDGKFYKVGLAMSVVFNLILLSVILLLASVCHQ